MQKIFVVILSFSLLLILCACGAADGSDPIASSNPPASEVSSVPTAASTEPTACSHIWFIATCTAPKTCKDCGLTEGDANGHHWEDATCTAPKTCTVCGTTEGNANAHNWADATYTAPKTCSTCGKTEGEPLKNSENYHGHVYTGGASSKKYHYEPECAGKNSHEITWEEVTQRGLEPCGTCVLQ